MHIRRSKRTYGSGGLRRSRSVRKYTDRLIRASAAAAMTAFYSWRLILCPPDVRRATVAHELAHLLHMDHIPAFHAAHARILGEDPKPARAWLREHGAGLHRYIV